MEKAKLVVPVRKLENSASNQLHGYDPEKLEKIKVKDDVNRLNHVKELINIDNDLKNLVKKVKIRRYIGLMYQITILKIYLSRHLAKLRNAKKVNILNSHIVQHHSYKKIDFNASLAQNQNLPSKSPNRMGLKMLPRTSKNQHFHKGGVFL
ncbi:uncharacterized protein cubi_00798 [Cryptosporidium ubiquitum]|uniref:Uncharacterized protein n=1 Tax=Cryptosporidium ubiquitum TaxID=857276 RepID=A0A1J4MEG8_9CRYT|nr:uncharacterized protein cubi_00798 [Cryptosporidium ubiquitum]OII71420.1 hypothetical protein cubi_00798 [Cryptosporidium ubiquitum]